MKVLILNNLPNETGIGKYVQILFDSLYPGIDLINFPSKTDLSTGVFSGKVLKPTTNSKVINALVRPVVQRKIVKYIDSYQGIVHYAGHSMYPLGKHCVKNRIGTIHDLIPLETFDSVMSTLYYRRNIRAMLDIPNIIVTTEIMKKKLTQEHHYSGHVFLVPYGYAKVFNSISSNNNLIPFKREDNKHYILSVSSDHPRKNLKIFPPVMDMLGQSFKLIRIGPPVPGSITFDHLSSELLAPIYRSCDVMVFPSLDEGFGIPMIEAFASGIPVAASDISVFREIGGEAVEFFDPNKPHEIVEAVRRIMANIERYKEKSLERAKLYSPELFAKRMQKIYNSLI